MEDRSDAALLDGLIARVENKQIDLGKKTHRWPASEYTDPRILEREIDVLFRRSPLIVGHAAQLPEPGTFFTHRLSGVPILLTRNRQGAIRAFLNICRHRGAIVENAACGARRAFVCPYHAWTYDLDGKLSGIPDKIGFVDVEPEKLGLVPLPVAERHGLIFVRPAPGGTLNAARHLGAVDAQLGQLGIGGYRLFHEEVISAAFNWKIGIDGAIEDYHFGFVHGKTASHLLYTNAAKYDHFRPHARLISPKRGILGLKKVPRERWNLAAETMITYLLFPNTVLLLPGDHFILFSAFPETIDRSILRYAIYVPNGPASAEQERRWSNTTRLSRNVVSEDLAVGESIQAALKAGADLPVHFGRCEQGVANFHADCARAVASNPRTSRTARRRPHRVRT